LKATFSINLRKRIQAPSDLVSRTFYREMGRDLVEVIYCSSSGL
jgi:hypothetical protein